MWSLPTKSVIFFAFPAWKELLISAISMHLSAHYATYPNLLQPRWSHSMVDRPSLFKPSATRPVTSVKKSTTQFGGSMATPGELNEKKTNSNVSHQHFLLFSVFFLYTWQAYIEKRKGNPLYWNVVNEKGPCRASNGPDSGPRRDHTRGVPEKWPSSSAALGIADKFAIFSSRGSGFFWWT